MKIAAFICFFAILYLPLFSQVGHKHYNFSSFTEDKKVDCPLLDQKSSDQAKKHPEYGIHPYDAGCNDCAELIDKRSEHSRQFLDPKHGTHTWSQQSYFPLHYLEAGRWRTIDPRLRPEPGQPGVFCAHHQPVPVKFNLDQGYTSLDLHSFEMIYNKGLKMYFAEDTNKAAIGMSSADFTHYTVGDDGARVFNIWPGIDMEAFADKGRIETNFIITSKLKMPVTKGYLVIEDHMDLPEGFTLEKAGKWDGRSPNDLLVRNKRGDEIARMEHVGMRNALHQGLETEYVVQRQGNSYTIKMLVPYSFLNTDVSRYPIVVDPMVQGNADTVIGIVDTGNYKSTHLAAAFLCYTTLPGHCDYHLIDTVPGHSRLVNSYLEIEFTTSTPGQFDGGRGCKDTLFSDHAAFSHVCNQSEISMVLISDSCNIGVTIGTNKQIIYYCKNNDCDTPGTTTTDSGTVPGASPVELGLGMLPCFPPQCPDYIIPWTLQLSDSICEDQCGNLCAFGTKWGMIIEACTLDASLAAAQTTTCASYADTLTCYPYCGVPPYTYRWSTGDTTQSIVIHPLRDEFITCTVYDACNDTDNFLSPIQITVIPSPVSNAGPDTVLCEQGGTVTLGGNPTVPNGSTFTWTASSPQAISWMSSTSAENPTVTIPPGAYDTTFYVVRAYDQRCYYLDTAWIYTLPNPTPVIDTAGPTKICKGQSLTLFVNGVYSSYLWSTGSTSDSIRVSAPGSYTVTVTDTNSCSGTGNHAVSVIQVQSPGIALYPDTTIFFGDSVQLYTNMSILPPVVDSFFWQPGDADITCGTCTNPTVGPQGAENYYYITVYSQGCMFVDSTLISVILPDHYYIPNVFTPNADGVNDFFYIYAQGGVTVNNFKVFDRWGEKVHEGNYAWDGQYKGDYCLPGIYAYEFNISFAGRQNMIVKGSVTLIR